MTTKIPWADKTWNPITGCTPSSEGCENCYARKAAYHPRLRGRFGYPADDPFRPGVVHHDKLAKPLHWRKPQRVFVCSMGDLFHHAVDAGAIAAVWGVMAMASQHTFMVLTKWPRRALELLTDPSWPELTMAMLGAVDDDAAQIASMLGAGMKHNPEQWPRKNVWFGVTGENQSRTSERCDILRKIPAAVRFLSNEPALERISVDRHIEGADGLDWVICGGENGPGARPMDLTWARAIRDQCTLGGIPFFFKGTGRRQPTPEDLEIEQFPEGLGEAANIALELALGHRDP